MSQLDLGKRLPLSPRGPLAATSGAWGRSAFDCRSGTRQVAPYAGIAYTRALAPGCGPTPGPHDSARHSIIKHTDLGLRAYGNPRHTAFLKTLRQTPSLMGFIVSRPGDAFHRNFPKWAFLAHRWFSCDRHYTLRQLPIFCTPINAAPIGSRQGLNIENLLKENYLTVIPTRP